MSSSLDPPSSMSLVIAGTSCSGKSVLGRKLAHRLNRKFIDCDEYHTEEFKRSQLPATPEYRRRWLGRVVDSLRPLLRSKEPVVLACSALTHEARACLLSLDEDLLIYNLEIPYEVAMQRSIGRDHWFRGHLLEDQYQSYQIPQPHPRLRTVDGTLPLDELEKAATDWIKQQKGKRSGVDKQRMVLFASHHWGICLIHEFLFGAMRHRVDLVGIVTDDPRLDYCNAKNRIWKSMPEEWEANVVTEAARHFGIDVFSGQILDKKFRDRYVADWRPDVCLMGVFGQHVDRFLCKNTRQGFYNFHPTVATGYWPAYPGANAFTQILQDQHHQMNIAMHEVTDCFDDGPLVAFSDPIPIAPTMSCRDVLIASGRSMARFAATQMENLSRLSHLIASQGNE